MSESLLTDNLLAFPAYDGTPDSRMAFVDALRQELIFHYENNEMYRRFCQRKGFDPHLPVEHIEDIPPVAVSVFKELGFNLNSVPREELTLALQSSATSGVPSTVVIDKITSRRQAKAMVKVIASVIGNERRPFLIMDIDPRSADRRLIGARFAAVTGYLKFASQTGYFLKARDGISYFDIDGITEFVKSLPADKPAVVFGFTYILFQNVLKTIEDNGRQITLPKGSKIIHIGGWKKLEAEKIDKTEFNSRLATAFGISPEDVVDIYGFTEQMGLNYPDCPCGCKHTSTYVDVIVRDPITREALPPGKEGMLEFVTPIPHSYPGNVVLTDDIGIIYDGKCPYGRAGTRFKVVGRMKKAEARGCGDILSAKLMFKAKADHKNAESKIDIQYFPGDADGDTPEEQLDSIISVLQSRQSLLANMPVEGIIKVIARTAEIWLNDSRFDFLKDKGRLFLSQWCSEKHLTQVARDGLRGNTAYADTFVPFPDSDSHLLKANPRGLVCHWMAGNVQILGFFALVQAMLTKNVNLLKVAAKDGGVFSSLMKAFEEVEVTMPDGKIIKGKDVASTVAVVYFSRNSVKLAEKMSSQADVRIAWGGKEAVETVARYPSKIDSQTVIFGPKLSMAAIGSESLSSLQDAKKLARRLSVDVSVFDQYGCASPHNVFIETGGEVSPEQFCEILASVFPKTEIQIPKGNMSVEETSAIHSIRGVYDFKGRVYGCPSMKWTVLLDPEFRLEKPVYSRVIFVHPVDSVMDAIPLIEPYIQSIGVDMCQEKAVRFALAATAKGVSRLPKIGRMLNFEMPWDGMFLIDRLVHWNTLGGPLL